jgi:hypothetical protein
MKMALALLALTFLGLTASRSLAVAPGETYTCHFGQYGKVVIDTRDPGSSITAGGKAYPAKAGSYFYQVEDGKIAFFSFNKQGWAYVDAVMDPNLRPIVDRHCVRRANGR